MLGGAMVQQQKNAFVSLVQAVTAFRIGGEGVGRERHITQENCTTTDSSKFYGFTNATTCYPWVTGVGDGHASNDFKFNLSLKLQANNFCRM